MKKDRKSSAIHIPVAALPDRMKLNHSLERNPAEALSSNHFPLLPLVADLQAVQGVR
jgi:hypothetical protein